MLGMDIDSQTAPTLVKDEFKEYEDGVVTGCQDPGEPAPSLSSFSIQSLYRVTAYCLAAIAVLPCMPLAYYTHDPSQIVRCPPYQTKQPLTGARIRAPENVFKWWAGETHLPNMCQLAFDHLSVPAMSSENERNFSDTKLIISDQRMRLGCDIVEALECLHHWEKSSL